MSIITLKNAFSRRSLLVYAEIFVPALFFLGIIILFATSNDIKFWYFSQDPVQTLNGKPYMGMVSNIGILFWCGAAAILVFSSLVMIRMNRKGAKSSFALFSGVLTLLLLFDDLFMFHETVSETLFFSVYFLSLGALVFFYMKLILETDYILWIISFLLLSMSVIIDVAARIGITLPHSSLLEDCAKFLGIVTWFSYFARTAWMFLIQE